VMGLAYVRTKAGGAGLKVMIGGVEAEVVGLDYVSHPIKES
jgi:tRNA-modifying protein YgfZ